MARQNKHVTNGQDEGISFKTNERDKSTSE